MNSIHKQHPDLNITKLIEFQTHIFENSPDIILLNETWLKPTINDSEIIPSDNYRIFRRDRSPDSHPPDPENPNKFKTHGGVLIAVKNSLDLKPKEIKTTCKAELLSIELTFPSRNKCSLSTLYRVGTLGYNHICEVESHFYSIFSIVSKIFERQIRDEILSHCRHLMHDTQHGFLQHKSCTTQLLPFSHDISLGLNSSELIDIVYFDFQKAFDTVNHDIIL